MEAKSIHAQGLELFKAGSLKESVDPLERARAASIAQGDALLAATVANDLGVVYYLLGRDSQAHDALRQALETFEQCGDMLGQARATGNLAQLQNRRGDRDNAERNYVRAADLFHQTRERRLEFDTYQALSQMQLKRGRWLEALAAYDRGLAAKGGSGLLRAFLQIPLKLAGLRP